MNKYRKAHPEWFDERGRVKPEILRELIDYNPDTGEMRWRERGQEWFLPGSRGTKVAAKIWNAQNAGKIAGGATKISCGIAYVQVGIFGVQYTGVSVAKAIIDGAWLGVVGMLDGDGRNLRASNLTTKSAAMSERSLGAGFIKDRGSSRFVGVSRHKSGWMANINVKAKRIYLGVFKTEEAAAAAYDHAAILHFGKAAYTNDVALPDKPAAIVKPKQKINTARISIDDF